MTLQLTLTPAKLVCFSKTGREVNKLNYAMPLLLPLAPHSHHSTTLCSSFSLPSFSSSSSSSSHPPRPLRILKFRTSHRETLRYLKSLGIVNPDLNKNFNNPSPETLSHVLSTVNFLKSKGFSEPDFPRLAFLCPKLFHTNFDPSDIEPVFDFLTIDLGASLEESCGLILKCPHILESNAEFCLKPTLDFLRMLGIQKLNSPTTLNAHLLDTRVDKLEEKLSFLRSVGFSRQESTTICARFPAIFGYSTPHNLRPKYQYLVRDMKRKGIDEINKFPQYFGFSLPRRIKPRHLHLKQRNIEGVPLNRMLLADDQKFFKKWR